MRKPAAGRVVDLDETPLEAPAEGVTDYAAADPAARAEIDRRIEGIDLSDSASVMGFGAGAQTELQRISQSMLAGVKNKEMGPAGDSLRQMVAALRGFSVSELDTRHRRSLVERITGRMAPMAKFKARFEAVRDQIDTITDELLSHEHQLLKDIKSLDQLYDRTLAFYHETGLYIAAGREKLRRLDQDEIPAMAAGVRGEDTMAAQDLRDLRSARDDLDRRVHDLMLTRQVTMQSLPSIRLVQENDKALVVKINSTLVNTVPLWETQVAQAVTISRSEAAADAVKDASDLTNDLLKQNAANLRRANAKVRAETERGVFDIEAVREANDALVATLEDSLRIADEGRARRAAAESELSDMETGLRRTLSAASGRDP